MRIMYLLEDKWLETPWWSSCSNYGPEMQRSQPYLHLLHNPRDKIDLVNFELSCHCSWTLLPWLICVLLRWEFHATRVCAVLYIPTHQVLSLWYFTVLSCRDMRPMNRRPIFGLFALSLLPRSESQPSVENLRTTFVIVQNSDSQGLGAR